jgi:hypothetical protein
VINKQTDTPDCRATGYEIAGQENSRFWNRLTETADSILKDEWNPVTSEHLQRFFNPVSEKTDGIETKHHDNGIQKFLILMLELANFFLTWHCKKNLAIV